jgi:hypothetical protein
LQKKINRRKDFLHWWEKWIGGSIRVRVCSAYAWDCVLLISSLFGEIREAENICRTSGT